MINASLSILLIAGWTIASLGGIEFCFWLDRKVKQKKEWAIRLQEILDSEPEF